MNSRRSPHSLHSTRVHGRAQRTFHEGERAMLRKRVFRRFRSINVQKLVRRGLERRRKWRERRRTPHPSTEKRPVFIVGSNRSGTNMVCGAIGKSPHGWDYRESGFSVAFNGYYLRQDWIIDWLIRRTPAPGTSAGSMRPCRRQPCRSSQVRGAPTGGSSAGGGRTRRPLQPSKYGPEE